MKKYLFTLMEDVCEAHNKDAAKQNELLSVMNHYGKIEDYEKAIAPIIAEHQGVIDNLTAQITSIKDQELTDDELAMVKAYRMAKSGVVAKHEAIEQECRQTIRKLEETLSAFKSKIIAVVGE